MNKPILIISDSFQDAWIKAIIKLSELKWEMYNLIVNITNPCLINYDINSKISDFLKSKTKLSAKDVAYTIFPHNLYGQYKNKDQLFERYMNKFFPWTRRKTHRGWGTYFERMINYERDNQIINQLDKIINAIKKRKTDSKAAYTIIIEKPGNETIRKMGAPCLNYIAIQIDHDKKRSRIINLLCIYRNHDFLNKTYGNYWGLCNLLLFLAKETNSIPGELTCVSSHAYVEKQKKELIELAHSFLND